MIEEAGESRTPIGEDPATWLLVGIKIKDLVLNTFVVESREERRPQPSPAEISNTATTDMSSFGLLHSASTLEFQDPKISVVFDQVYEHSISRVSYLSVK